MNFWLKILVCAAFFVLLYGIFRLMAVIFVDHELKQTDVVKRKENTIEIFADVESLEYYLRLAISVSGNEIPVVAYVKKDSKDKEDMIDIIARLHREHKNVTYELI